VIGVALGVAVGLAVAASYAQEAPSQALIDAARDAGVDVTDLEGAVNTTGLEPREYLYQVGELERPYTPPPARPSMGAVGPYPYGLSPYLARVAWCESRYNPRAVGRLGEIGLFQLKPGGMLPVFYAWGGTNPWSAEQQARFAEWAFTHGYAGRWSCS